MQIGEIKVNVHFIIRERESLGTCARQYEEGAPDEIEVSVSRADAASQYNMDAGVQELGSHAEVSATRGFIVSDINRGKPCLVEPTRNLRSEAAIEMTRRDELVQLFANRVASSCFTCRNSRFSAKGRILQGQISTQANVFFLLGPVLLRPILLWPSST